MLIAAILASGALTEPALADCSPHKGDYIINDVQTFASKISSALKKRDQFISDAEYQATVDQAFQLLTKDLGPEFNGQFALIVDRSDRVSFDANRGILTIPGIANERYSLGSITTAATRNKGYHGAYLAGTVESAGTYQTTNGFGAPVTVTKFIYHNVGFAWDNKRFKMENNGSMGSPKNEVIAGLSGDQARTFSSGLKAIVRGRLTFPFVTMETVPGSPSFRNPVDKSAENIWLFMEPEQVCIADAAGNPLNEWKITPR